MSGRSGCALGTHPRVVLRHAYNRDLILRSAPAAIQAAAPDSLTPIVLIRTAVLDNGIYNDATAKYD